MTNEPEERNVKLTLPDEGLDAIRILFDELRKRIERTVTNEKTRAIALQHLQVARTHCIVGADRTS